MIYKFRENIQFVESETDCYIEDLVSGERFWVSGAGIDFLSMVDGKRTIAEILQGMAEIYGKVEPLVLAADMERFVGDLMANCLLELA